MEFQNAAFISNLLHLPLDEKSTILHCFALVQEENFLSLEAILTPILKTHICNSFTKTKLEWKSLKLEFKLQGEILIPTTKNLMSNQDQNAHGPAKK